MRLRRWAASVAEAVDVASAAVVVAVDAAAAATAVEDALVPTRLPSATRGGKCISASPFRRSIDGPDPSSSHIYAPELL